MIQIAPYSSSPIRHDRPRAGEWCALQPVCACAVDTAVWFAMAMSFRRLLRAQPLLFDGVRHETLRF